MDGMGRKGMRRKGKKREGKEGEGMRREGKKGDGKGRNGKGWEGMGRDEKERTEKLRQNPIMWLKGRHRSRVGVKSSSIYEYGKLASKTIFTVYLWLFCHPYGVSTHFEIGHMSIFEVK